LNTFKTPTCKCPVCSYEMDACSGVDGDSAPAKDDITVCYNCATLLLFNDDLTIRLPTVQERKEIPTHIIETVDKLRHALNTIESI